jgi:hypothetical protein
VGDVTSDGWPDLVVAARQDSAGSVRSWMWAPGAPGLTDSIAPSITGIRLADIDGDGFLDALTTSDHANAVTVRYDRGDGTFGPRHDHIAGPGAADLVAADFDGDGDLDIAVANARGNSVTVLENRSASAPTPVQISLVSAEATPGRVRLVWFVPDGGDVVIERHAGADWVPLAAGQPDGSGYLRHDDDTVLPGRRYGYRLGRSGAGQGALAGETWLDVPERFAFALRGANPNPARGALRVFFTLPDDRPATLGVWDVAGRRVATKRVDAHGAGTHSIEFGASSWAPGVYLIRLSRGTESLQARVAVVR